jgi:glutamate N-acetyltransferase/amino-acid N-acetyltransferase
MKIIETGSVDSVPGFHALGVSCGIKQSGEPDLGVLLCERPCNAAGVFTTNRVQAAPVLVSKKILERSSGHIQGVVVNSGNANACTGKQGIRDAGGMAAEAERIFGLEESTMLVMSTGLIGKPLLMDRIKAGLLKVREGFNAQKGGSFARALMTTDTKEKFLAVRFDIQGVPVTIGAAAKGSGMIHPNMATMLALFTTDAAVSPACLNLALRRVTERTFNMISVDGDCSPNDIVFILASGACGAPLIENEESPGYKPFYSALLAAATELARAIVADGEGATKLVEIRVKGADSFNSASKVARAVANSPLVKTALFGEDPNWGRIVCAIGYSGVPVDPDKIDIFFGDIQAVKQGAPSGVSDEECASRLKEREIVLTIGLNQGGCECSFWTCDFSYDYVRINAEYHT